MGYAKETISLISRNSNYEKIIKQTKYILIEPKKTGTWKRIKRFIKRRDLSSWVKETINCCRKTISNNEVREVLKTKFDREVADITYWKFKAKLNLTKNEFMERLLYEIIAMKTSGATDGSVRRWLAEEH